MRAFSIHFFFAVFFFAACSKKPAQIAYLSPLDRSQEGFLDQATYQILSYATALDFTKGIDAKINFFPQTIDAHFAQDQFVSFNETYQQAIKTKQPMTVVSFADVMAAEIQQLSPKDLDLSSLDPGVRAPMEIKRVLFDNACMEARVQGLYRWLLGDAMQIKYVHGEQLPTEAIHKVGLNPNYYPPKAYYVADASAILGDLEAAMKRRKFRYEIVYETLSKPNELECKVAIFIHKRHLQVDSPYLVSL